MRGNVFPSYFWGIQILMKRTLITILPNHFREVQHERSDTEGNKLKFDAQYELTNGNVWESIEYLKASFNGNLQLIPIGGLSAGSGIFSIKNTKPLGKVVGFFIAPPTPVSDFGNIDFSISNSPPIHVLNAQELHIDQLAKNVYAGAGVILDQIIATVKHALGKNHSVLGADLTSSGYASAGATYMTGGMGPSRINFANNIKEIIFYDGQKMERIQSKTERSHLSETYGYTGIVAQVALPIIEMPAHEFGLALPINYDAEELARAAAYFVKNTSIQIADNKITNAGPIIFGMEFLTRDALEMLSPTMPQLATILQSMTTAKKNALLFITGYAHQHPFQDLDDSLGIFVENNITGLALEHAVPFDDLKAMKTIREGAPDAARSQFANAQFTYKDHTDINIRLNPNNVAHSMKQVVECYQGYETKLNAIINDTQHLQGNVQVYGHFNPQGVDPHCRVSLACDDEKILKNTVIIAKDFFEKLVVDLSKVCTQTGSTLLGGEKGIISNQKILSALQNHGAPIPAQLLDKFTRQKKAIRGANSMFAWRSKVDTGV